MKSKYLLTALCSLTLSLLQAADAIPEGWFAFQTNPLSAPADSMASMAFLNPQPATRRISVKDGHFVYPDGTPVRFFGSNICIFHAFPAKDTAPITAARLKQLGVNVIRIHQIDIRDIWNKDKTAIDPVQLDKLHWLLYQLRENGIYVDLNLHVSRTYPGLVTNGERSFNVGKCLDRFYPPFIDMQKQYAIDLLKTVNPYTKLAPADDPGIAFVEINNENTIAALNNPEVFAHLKGTPYYPELQSQWRRWLTQKYAALPQLIQAWNANLQPYQQQNMLADVQPLLEGPQENFILSHSDSETSDFSLKKDGKVDWAYQVHYPVTLKPNTNYTIKFEARASKERVIHVNLRVHEAPWTVYAGKHITLKPEWQTFCYSASVKDLVDGKRNCFTLNLRGFETPVDIQFRHCELHEGDLPYQPAGLQAIQELPLPSMKDNSAVLADFRAFLLETEFNTTRLLRDFLKNELKVKALITDSQASYGGWGGLYRESRLSDYIDMHSYWQHPSFAKGHSWSPIHWTIPNTPMVNSKGGGILSWLAAYRYAGMPFSVSEYDHPRPAEHSHEMFPMMASFAAFQDWDALYHFRYGQPVAFNKPVAPSFFPIADHPGKMILTPFAALLFRQRLVAPAATVATVSIPLPELRKSLASHIYSLLDKPLKGWPQSVIGNAQYQVKLTENGDAVSVDHGEALTGLPLASPQIQWTNNDDKGVYSVNAPAIRIAAGYISGRDMSLGDFSFSLQLPDTATATVAVTSLSGKPLAESGAKLLAVVGTVSRVGMKWNEERTTITNQWGQGPAITRFIPATFTLPGTSKPVVHALDPDGVPFAEIPVTGGPGRWSFSTSQATPTLWFAIRN